MARTRQVVLIISLLAGSWLGMQLVHELGHVVGATLTNARVVRVVLHPLTISRTDVEDNSQPLVVVWAGPVIGAAVPLLAWGIHVGARGPWTFLTRFFAGFCLIANGAYIGSGAFTRIGDAGDMLRHGAPGWSLLLFGMVTVPLGLWLWNGQGRHFGLGAQAQPVLNGAAITSLVLCLGLLALGFAVGGR